MLNAFVSRRLEACLEGAPHEVAVIVTGPKVWNELGCRSRCCCCSCYCGHPPSPLFAFPISSTPPHTHTHPTQPLWSLSAFPPLQVNVRVDPEIHPGVDAAAIRDAILASAGRPPRASKGDKTAAGRQGAGFELGRDALEIVRRWLD